MTDKKKKTTKFTSDNQPKNRKGRGKSPRTLIIDALKAQSKNETEFWSAVVQKALFGGPDGDGDSQMMTLVAKKLFPDPKATLPSYSIKWPKNGSRLEKADAIWESAAQGDLPIDAAKMFLDGLADTAKVEEIDVLSRRIADIEAQLGLAK